MGGGHLLGVGCLMVVRVLFTIRLTCNHVKTIIINVCLNVFISRQILFQTLISFITFSKPKPNYLSVLNFVCGHFIGVKTIEKPSLGRPLGSCGRLIEVAG